MTSTVSRPKELELLYFKTPQLWRDWLHDNHTLAKGVELVFYRVDSEYESMRWEEAVQVAICYGWIDSTVRRVDDERRKQLFTPRKAKSAWSKLNKSYVEQLTQAQLMHDSGLKVIETAKQNGAWTGLDAVESLEMPSDLAAAFARNPSALNHYNAFSPSYRKSYLYWLNHAKREETRLARIAQIVALCEQNIKARP
jgi:uncharacterized protein YdeI (YjbR/CyaY-like superfamily)